MVDTVSTQVLQDNVNAYRVKLNNVSDATGETDVLKVDFSTIADADRLELESVEYATAGMAVTLLWDATANDVLWSIPADHCGYHCFKNGPLTGNHLAGFTNDVLLTTVGAVAGASYSIILHFKKRIQRSL